MERRWRGLATDRPVGLRSKIAAVRTELELRSAHTLLERQMPKPSVEIVSSMTAREVERMRVLAQPPILQIGSKEAIDRQQGSDPRSIVPEMAGAFSYGRIHRRRHRSRLQRRPGRRHLFGLCRDPCETRWTAVRIHHLSARPGTCPQAVGRRAKHSGAAQAQRALLCRHSLGPGFPRLPSDYWRFSFPGLLELFDELEFVDIYYSASGTGFDAAYKVLIDGAVDLARTPFDIEGMPVLFVNALGRKRS
jgi:hypothetical protein